MFIVAIDWQAYGRKFMVGETPNGYTLVSEYPDAFQYSRREAMKAANYARSFWKEADSVRVYSNYGTSDERYTEVL